MITDRKNEIPERGNAPKEPWNPTDPGPTDPNYPVPGEPNPYPVEDPLPGEPGPVPTPPEPIPEFPPDVEYRVN